MVKKELYPKTPRISVDGERVYVTEKLDGSNLIFFKVCGELYIAQRKTIYSLSEYEENPSLANYRGLGGWLNTYGRTLKDSLNDNAAICGEWLGMGKVKYDVGDFDKRFYMFAKANIDVRFELYNIKYDHNLFIYPFVDKEIPVFIGVVPEVAELTYIPNKYQLDKLYDKYTQSVGRIVEGFVLNYCNIVTKYVRLKNGKLVEYSDSDHKTLE